MEMHAKEQNPGVNSIVELPRKIRKTLLPPRTLELEHLDALQEENVTVELASALDIEDKMVPHAAQLHLILELLVSQTLSANRVFEGIADDGL